MPEITVPVKHEGDELPATEFNQVVKGVNDVALRADASSHALSTDDFKEEGTTTIEGEVLPVLRIKDEALKRFVFFDLSQFNGDGTEANPYSIKPELLGGVIPGKLATPALSVSTGLVTGTYKNTLNWTSVTDAETYELQRADNAAFTLNQTTLSTDNVLQYIDGAVEEGKQYWYRVKAKGTGFADSFFSTVNIVTGTEGVVTPNPPTVVCDDSANTIVVSHTLGLNEIVCSVSGGSYIALTSVPGWNVANSRIDVGDVARAAGYFKFKTKAAPGRAESAVVNSEEFTVSPVNKYMTGHSALPAILSGLASGNPIDNADGSYSSPFDNSVNVTSKYQMVPNAELAIKFKGAVDEDGGIGLVSSYELRNKYGVSISEGIMYIDKGSEYEESPSQPNVGDWIVLRYVEGDGEAVNKELLVFIYDGSNYTQVMPELRLNYVHGEDSYVSMTIGHGDKTVFYPQGKDLVLAP